MLGAKLIRSNAGILPGDDDVVETDFRSTTFDRELDVTPGRPAFSPRESFAGYQRLIANPFPTVLGWVAVYFMIRLAIQNHGLLLFVAGIGLFLASAALLQYHCLDCGKSGWLFRYSRHACESVIARWRRREVRRFRGPGVKVQLVLWLYLLVSALVLYGILLRHGR
jgi:hypothetical protein